MRRFYSRPENSDRESREQPAAPKRAPASDKPAPVAAPAASRAPKGAYARPAEAPFVPKRAAIPAPKLAVELAAEGAADAGKREIPVCGHAAVKALFQNRPHQIKRLFFDAVLGRRVGAMSGFLAGQRRIYRQVEPAELEKIAGTVHHGGIVAIIDEPAPREPQPADVKRWAEAGADVVILDRIGNAHNLGAIARTLAFFGVRHLVVSADEKAARPGESTYRVAEGGLEHVHVWAAPDIAALCQQLRAAGFAVAGADVRGKHLKALRRKEFGAKPAPAKTAESKEAADAKPAKGEAPKAQPVALVVGNEEAGLAPAVAQACERLVRIPGSDKMESLNVSAATAILVAAMRTLD